MLAMPIAQRPSASPPRLSRCAALALLGWASLTTTGAVQAQRPLSEASVESLVAALSGAGRPDGLVTRSFRRTQLPDAASNLCAESAKPARAPQAQPNRPDQGGPTTRNLEVVPYAGDATPGVNLSVQFATGSDRLAPGDRALLDNVAAALKTPTLASEGFAIAGHTDSTGEARINLELSCARAQAVRRYLVDRGVAEARLTAYGFGNARPIDGDTAAAANRRVEVRRAPQ